MRKRAALWSMCAALVLTGGAVVVAKRLNADRCLVRAHPMELPGPPPQPQPASTAVSEVTRDPDLPLPAGVGKVAAEGAGPVVAFVPHQDDEALWMGADLSREIAAGRQVIVVLVHNGNGTGARGTLLEKCGIDLGPRGVPDDKLVKARMAEFTASTAQLGVSPANVMVDDRNRPDSQASIVAAKRMMRQWIMKYPQGSYRTMSWIDQSLDHAALGYALDELARAGEVNDPGFYLKRELVKGALCGGQRCVTPPVRTVPGTERAVQSLREYTVFKPEQGRFAVGRQSVSQFFEEALKDPQSYLHGSSATWGSAAEAATSTQQMRVMQKDSWDVIRRR